MGSKSFFFSVAHMAFQNSFLDISGRGFVRYEVCFVFETYDIGQNSGSQWLNDLTHFCVGRTLSTKAESTVNQCLGRTQIIYLCL